MRKSYKQKGNRNYGKKLFFVCVYTMYMHTCVCAHLFVCKCRPHLPSTHLKVRTQDLSLLSAVHGCVCWRGGPPWSLVTKAPPWQARHHAQHDVGPGALHARPCAYLLSHLPPLFLFTYFFFLWILWIYAEFMGYGHLMVGIHLGKESPGDLCHAMSSAESTDLMWTLDESNTWCTLHMRGCCWHSTARWSSLPSW